VHIEDVLQLAEVVDARAPQFGLVGDHPFGGQDLLQVLDNGAVAEGHFGSFAQWKIG